MSRYYAGFDPGTSGAVSIFHESGQLETVFDIPVKKTKSGKKEVDANALYAELLKYKILHAYVEFVHAMPGQGVSGVFGFGQSLGIIKGVLAGSEIKCSLITPQRWKKNFGLLKKEKDMARQKIISMFPEHTDFFRRKKDTDRADACLICLCGMGRFSGVSDV